MVNTIIFEIKYLGHCGRGYDERVMRKIEMEETQSLNDLHEAIIYQAFKWDDPHLYSFFMDNKPFSRDRSMEYTPEDPEEHINMEINGQNSSYTKLKDLGLTRSQKLLFVFDFGDDHHFEITVKEFGKSKEGKLYPVILEEIGTAPKQYPPLPNL